MTSLAETYDWHIPEKICSVIQTTEAFYTQEFNEMVSLIDLHDEANVRRVYVEILDIVFATKISLGRIIAAMIFTQKLQHKAETDGLAGKIHMWWTEYISRRKLLNEMKANVQIHVPKVRLSPL